MKNNLGLTLILIISGFWNSSAQVKFIEVMVKETISLKTISYEFEVSSGLKFKYDYENPNSENAYSKKLWQSEEKIVAL